MPRSMLQRIHNPRNRECGCDPDCWCRRTSVGRAVKWWLPAKLIGLHHQSSHTAEWKRTQKYTTRRVREIEEAREAYAPVLRDVAATTNLRLTIRHTTDETGPVVVVSPPDSSDWYIRIHEYRDIGARIGIATREVQELVIEELWRHGSNWPVCPAHPTTHPMELTWMPDGPWWACPADGTAVAAVGSLTL